MSDNQIDDDSDVFLAMGTLSAAYWMLTEFLKERKQSTGINALIDIATGFDGFSLEDKKYLKDIFEDILHAKKVLSEDTKETLKILKVLNDLKN